MPETVRPPLQLTPEHPLLAAISIDPGRRVPEMPYEFEIVVPTGKKKERLDVFLTNHVENATRNKVQNAIKDGNVLIDGNTVRPSHLVAPGEVIHITLPKSPPQDVQPENIPMDILYEDDYLLVVNKPSGMVTHPAYANYSGTLVNALLYHCNHLSTLNDATRPGIVHRLDKNTSGLMVIAKTDAAHAHLAKQFARRTISREYQAIVWGRFREHTGVIETDLGRSKSDRKKMAVVENGKKAITTYTVLEQFQYLCLLQLTLKTGRTHQIRVHLAHINHPVFGDPTYNGRRISEGPHTSREKTEIQKLLASLPRQALHAKTIGFVHPANKQVMEFNSDLPKDMALVLSTLRDSSG
jgi:23S rRNA pseudouridine1911/1915/1917 synthase